MSTASEELYPLLDMHGQHVQYIDYAECQRLRREGYTQSYGTRKRITGYKLTVPLQSVSGYDYCGRSLVPSNFAGTRYIFRLKIAGPKVNSHIYRYKRIKVTESPEHALLRMLTPVALESSVYTPRDQATETEGTQDPGKDRRRDVAGIFRFPDPEPVSHNQTIEVADEVRWQPLWDLYFSSRFPEKPHPKVIEMPLPTASEPVPDFALAA